jgi:hypothetical protein
MDNDRCAGEHEIYVADVAGSEADGKLVVITVCRHCDRVQFHVENVFSPGADIQLKSEKGKT